MTRQEANERKGREVFVIWGNGTVYVDSFEMIEAFELTATVQQYPVFLYGTPKRPEPETVLLSNVFPTARLALITAGERAADALKAIEDRLANIAVEDALYPPYSR